MIACEANIPEDTDIRGGNQSPKRRLPVSNESRKRYFEIDDDPAFLGVVREVSMAWRDPEKHGFFESYGEALKAAREGLISDMLQIAARIREIDEELLG
jgi:hypothetical protein